MKKIINKKSLLSALGKAAREVYLKDNPHGFSQTSKVYKNKKHYSRKQKQNYENA